MTNSARPHGLLTAREAAQHHWDVIVIGTGMGGGLAGRRLAERGLAVLYVEKGPVGHRTEAQFLRVDLEDYVARQSRGLWPTGMETIVDGGPAHRFFGLIGSGVGGSSVFYAAAAERPERHDLESTPAMAHPTGGWPIGYDAFRPYYDQAEELLSVRGEADPLSDAPAPALAAPPLTDAEAALFEDLRRSGLHPYRAHEALRRVPGCGDCLGHKCPRPCKMDGRSAGVEPALLTGKAALLPDCTVEELIETSGRITALRARTRDGELRLAGEIVILAGGALNSPGLLLRSTGTHPEGCANSSGWVGRGVMFHLNEMVALWPRRGQAAAGTTRAVAFRDLYTDDGQRLGLIQSQGVVADAGRIAGHLKETIARTPLRRVPGVGKAATVFSRLGARIFGNATIFSAVIEDLAYPENRVRPHPDDPEVPLVEYRIPDELKARRVQLRRALRQRLSGHRMMFLTFAPLLNFGHPCGTLRFGHDPKTSVLDADCRAHDLDNLYVADASFLPSSTGVNPSLTIAANALRVADIVAARLVRDLRKAG